MIMGLGFSIGMKLSPSRSGMLMSRKRRSGLSSFKGTCGFKRTHKAAFQLQKRNLRDVRFQYLLRQWLIINDIAGELFFHEPVIEDREF